ncbi:hypothetical protein OPU71_16935 [Niveibacterium sp. 24ML]|uniref:FliG C-terminal domain-containing protein n=1 Tax=Niveibacterium sp. 24ML TaxID=2985512 RepID=UPI00226EB1B5|nr:FliG C-terminal domain-containing protein [Niveibacterium sp. 24ML]MCX9157811.1 hypothetical protein [Niveibacterium sp. 24ML]
MTPHELTELLFSLDDRLFCTAQSVFSSRLMAQRRGDFESPDFETLQQLSGDERYRLSLELDDNTLVQALKAASRNLRHLFLRDTSWSRKRRIIGKMRRLGCIRQSVANRAVEAVLAELERQRAIGAISRELSDDEIKRGIPAIRAGLAGSRARPSQIRADIAEVLGHYLHIASDAVLSTVVQAADPLDLALLLLQLRSPLLIERMLVAGECTYLRELLDSIFAILDGDGAPAPGHPERRLWQIVTWELYNQDAWEIDTLFPVAAEVASVASGPAGSNMIWTTLRNLELYGWEARTYPDPNPDAHEKMLALIKESARNYADWPEPPPPEPLTAAQQRRIDAIEASSLARMRRRSDEQMRRAIARKSDARRMADAS